MCIGISTPPSKTLAPLPCQAPPSPPNSANCPSPPFLGNPPLYYLLKVTKILGKISQFEFLVMTEKSIFAYKLFLSLKISDFFSVCVKISMPPWKKSLPLKVEVLSSPLPLFENLVGGSTPNKISLKKISTRCWKWRARRTELLYNNSHFSK